MKLIFFISFLICSTKPLGTIIFGKNGDKDIAEFSFEKSVFVKDYSIMTGELNAKEDQFTQVYRDDTKSGTLDKIIVDLKKIPNRSSNKLYGIKVSVIIQNEREDIFSEAFRYNEKTKSWELNRVYNQNPWYKRNIYYVIGVSFIFVSCLVGYLLYRKNRSNISESF